MAVEEINLGPMESERRHATVLFADVSGFTAMSEKLDPEDVVEVMNRCFAVLERAVLRYGGHVDKYEGDCIMATFGAPTAIENTARAAVNTAIDMRNSIYEFAKEKRTPAPLNIHIGINTGLVVSGEVGGDVKRDVTVMGDTVNLAARLKDASPKGKIWVGPNTYRFTRRDFEYETLAPLTLKNKANPVPAYELRSVRTGLPRAEPTGVDQLVFSTLVGRAHEIARIQTSLANVLAGKGGIVSLAGEAGLGKSRLLADALATDRLGSALRLEGHSLSIGRNLSFHPFISLLRAWCGSGQDDRESEVLRKLERALAHLMGEEAAEVFPFVATLMGLRPTGEAGERVTGIDGEALEKLILKNVRSLFQAMARSKPLVLVFEDLHWADESSLTLLAGLLRLVLEEPILFVLVSRSELGRTVQRIAKSLDDRFANQHVRIALEPLDAKQCDELIQNLLRSKALPYSLRAEITRKGEGNPFYIEEVVRGLIDEGVVKYGHGAFALTDKIDAVVIPGTIQEVIMARIDRLPPRVKTLAQLAAVIGRNFPYRIIAALADRDAQSLGWDLRHLKRQQLIVERKMHGEPEYVFKHALMQETIYESIIVKTRRALHLKVAETIERLFADRLADFYGMLAYHYNRGDNAHKAEEYLFKAGDEAARAAASTEALHFFREASRLYFQIHGEEGDPKRKALLEKNVGLALLNTGNLLESVDHFNRALEFLGESVPSTPASILSRFVVDMTALLGRVYLSRGKPPIGRERANDRESLHIRYNRARAQTTSDTRRVFFDTMSSVRLLSGTDPRAIDQAAGMYAGAAAAFAFSGLSFRLSRRFLGIAEALVRKNNIRDSFVLRSYQFLVDYFEGDWSPDRAIEVDTVEQALRYGLAWDANTYLGLHCEQAIVQGEFQRAEQDVALLARIAEEYGFEFARSNQYFMSAYALLEQRQLAPAMKALDRYHSGRHEQTLNLLALGTRARIQLLAGEREQAAVTLATAEPMVSRLVPPYHLSTYRASRFLHDVVALEDALHGHGGDVRRLSRRARASGRAALRVAAKIARDWTQVHRIAGRLNWLLGKQDAALQWWARSLVAGERLGARPELARTYREIGQRLSEEGSKHRHLNGLAALDALAKARETFTALGLDWDLAQLDAARCAA